MSDRVSTKPTSLKGWVVLGLLLSISIDLAVSAFYTAHLLLSLFLPLITAVIAYRFGMRVYDFLFVMAVPAMMSAGSYLTDTLTIAFDIPQWSFLLSIVTAFVFCQPPINLSNRKIFNKRWRWSRWLLLVAFWLMLHDQAGLDFELADSVSIRIGAGSVLLVVVLLISVQWNEFQLQFESVLSLARSRFGYYIRIAIALLLGMAMFVSVDVDIGYILDISFGFSDGMSWVLVLAFCTVAFGMVDWRLAIAVAAVMLALEDNLWRLYEYLETLLVVVQPPTETAADSGLGRIVVTARRLHYSHFWFNVIHAVSFILMAVALRPCLANRNPELLRSSRSLAFLTLSTGVLFIATPLILNSLSGPGHFVLATLAFGIGYRWRLRGILLGPIILQLTYLMCVVVLTLPGGHPPSALHAIDIGLVSFMAAFFGMLLNRHSLEAPGAALSGGQST